MTRVFQVLQSTALPGYYEPVTARNYKCGDRMSLPQASLK